MPGVEKKLAALVVEVRKLRALIEISPRLVPFAEAARSLGVSVSALRRMVKKSEVLPVTHGRQQWLPISELRRLRRKPGTH